MHKIIALDIQNPTSNPTRKGGDAMRARGFRAMRAAIDTEIGKRGNGLGLGNGICKVFCATATALDASSKDLQRQALQNSAELLRAEFEMIDKRLKDLSE